MGIVLVTVGKIDWEVIKKIEVLKKLQDNLYKVFNRQIFIGKEMPEPDYAFNKKRNQYLSTAIINAIMEQKEYTRFEKILGIVDHDLYVPVLNFVFGVAGEKAAVISLTRLRQEFYDLTEDRSLFNKRVLTEAVHELGHTYGLSHCTNPWCVMFFSNNIVDTDVKGYKLCPICKSKLYLSDNFSLIRKV